MKKKYYRLDSILKTNAEYLMLLGMRSNGKSYAVKEFLLEKAFNENEKFVYLRRYKDDIKQYYVESYFSDMPIEKITKGIYDQIIAWQGYIYFAKSNEDPTKPPARGTKIGRYCALNEAVRYKSNAFVNYKYIDYEEFITDGVYLSEEPEKLQQFISTVARDQNITVFLIGNTISRVCPYFSQWQLSGTLRQKPGTIEIYRQHDDKGNLTASIAVENCTIVENTSKMFFGNATKQILSGEWDVKASPRLPGKIEDFESIYNMQIAYQMFIFNIKLLIDEEGCIYTYVYPGKELKKDGRILSTDFSTSPQTTTCFNKNNRAECRIIDCFNNGKVCFSDNLTAADFEQVRQQYRFI